MKALVDRWVATREGFKPRDVEEPIDYYWHRPVAGLLVDVLAPTAITPNQMTLLSGVASASAGAALCAGAWGASWWGAVAGLLLFVSITFDCADGQLARIRGTSTMLGRILDGATDFVAPLSVFLGMAAYLLMPERR